MKKSVVYKWDERNGIVDQDGVCVLQLLLGPASIKFRRYAGQLLVEALNNAKLREE